MITIREILNNIKSSDENAVYTDCMEQYKSKEDFDNWINNNNIKLVQEKENDEL